MSTAECLRLKDVLKDVFKASIICLEDGVLSAHVQWPLLLNRILETAVSKPTDGLQEKKTKQKTAVRVKTLEQEKLTCLMKTVPLLFFFHLIGVVHSHSTAPCGEVVHLPLLWVAPVSWGENHFELAGLVNHKVGCPVLRKI